MSRWTIPRAWAAASARATSAAIRGGLGRRERPGPAKERGQVLAVDVVHDDERAGLVHPEVVDGDDVRRVERGDRLGLHPEAGDEVGVAAVLGAQDLDGDVAAELAVGGSVDRGHAALAEELDQPISPTEDASDLSQV